MSLSAAKKRDILICCIAALLILCAMAARILGSPEWAPGLGSMIRNGIYMGLTAAWGVSVQRRIIQAQTRRYLIAIALLMLLWLTERAIKYEFNLSAASARRLWYSYYIPILLIPLITVFTAMSLGRPENYKLPGWTRLLYIPTFAFMAMVLTNDRHQLVFAFPADAEIWTGGNAAHSIGYFAVVAWTAVCAAGTIIVMIEKCRRPKSRIQWLPILPVALSFVYTALYVSDVKWLRLIAGDMTVFQCLAIMAALEGCIRCGLIQSNTGYDELFGATTIGAQITDHGFRVKSASHSALPISLEKMEQALEGPVQLDKNTLLKGQEISSGYVFWQEDISELQGVLDQFQTVQDELRDTGDVLKAEAEQRSYWLKITEENRLYDMVERKTQRQVALLRKLLSRLRATEDTEEARRLLGHIVVIGTYVKRRSNLMFVERQITDKSGGSYTEVTASDVTRLVTLQQELRKENARLEDANLRLKRLYDRMPEIVREEETLAMKLRVHDDIGHTILSARRALRQGESMEAIRESAEAWESTIELLCRANSMGEPEDAIEYAKARAAELGAEVIVEGSAPRDAEMRHIFALAMRECTSNCIRHAGGKRIFARFAPYRGGWAIHITNDGKVPDDEITEGGGLSALRRRIENAGGIMRIKSIPNFALSASLPYGEENKW